MATYFPPLTAAEAALLAGVLPATIRQWRHRGFLTPVGGTTRAPLYDGRAVLATARARKAPAVNAA
ncbi:hypothetical protein [Streptomyces filamentosus]